MKKRGKDLKTLIITKGIGIAPGILASHEFRQRGSVDMIVDTEKISEALIDDYLDDGNGMLLRLSLTGKSSEKQLTDIMQKKQYDNVILLASDYYIDTIGRITKKILPAADLAVSNNFRICCGEGLCGSCSIDASGGDTIKMCKCQMNGEDFLNNVFYSRASG